MKEEKTSGSIHCSLHEKSSYSSVVMEDATPLTPSSAWAELFFKCKQHTIHDPWGPENYNFLDILTKHTNWVQQNSMILSVLFKKWNVCKHIPKEETQRKAYTTLGCVILRDIKMRCTCIKYLNKILLTQCNNSNESYWFIWTFRLLSSFAYF